ncbi:50S ribosomal protein L6, chloroplastic [Apostasia shenzhenica]|uniref:50S ribosomal protein L6, chloroplastic n=1 Tax=Apostasia shenzhenica TaxID=1088818 RepID=A0A2I0BFH3_9ASPA|nr:50S ribosomal protein L6, chloroplastic [Apostasia shenzhenica]
MVSFSTSMHSSFNLKSVFLGERSAICTSESPAIRVGLLRKPVQCKESRIGKRPIEVPSNVNITMEGQDVRVKGPLGELSLTLPREMKIERQESGSLRIHRALETRRAYQMHGLFR